MILFQQKTSYMRQISSIAILLISLLSAFTVHVQAQTDDITATVSIAALNVRSGPGTTYSRISGVKKGDVLLVLGQINNCAWLQIRTAQNLDGWVAGSSRYVTLNVACGVINAVTVPAASTNVTATAPVSTTTPATPTLTDGGLPSWLAPGAEPYMAAELEQKVPLKNDQSCILFQNFAGGFIYITLTQQDGGHIEEIPMEAKEEKVLCLPGGKYSVTITSRGLGQTGGMIKFYNGTRDVFRIFGR